VLDNAAGQEANLSRCDFREIEGWQWSTTTPVD
jgi:hypothetical protein